MCGGIIFVIRGPLESAKEEECSLFDEGKKTNLA
jgi:hypothetical protein